jgi:acetolactate synthase-1/2/3 large subunit
MRVADAIFQRLEQEVDTVFLVPGGGAMYLVDALGRSELHYVAAIHEQGAGFMAIGYAMLKGLGVCLVTSGPGVTNAITACLAAWTDSVPVLFISGQARSDTLAPLGMRTMGVQEGPTIAVVQAITKLSWEPLTPQDVMMNIDNMVDLCQRERKGPCWLSVPQDVQGMEI